MDGRRQIHMGDSCPYIVFLHAPNGACLYVVGVDMMSSSVKHVVVNTRQGEHDEH
jgi:hypothetical protein